MPNLLSLPARKSGMDPEGVPVSSTYHFIMENNNNEAKKTAQKVGGLLFTGCMFLGMAAGWYLEKMTIGIIAGMGMGFILMAVTYMSSANKK